jgi:hypothetical protein
VPGNRASAPRSLRTLVVHAGGIPPVVPSSVTDYPFRRMPGYWLLARAA